MFAGQLLIGYYVILNNKYLIARKGSDRKHRFVLKINLQVQNNYPIR